MLNFITIIANRLVRTPRERAIHSAPKGAGRYRDAVAFAAALEVIG